MQRITLLVIAFLMITCTTFAENGTVAYFDENTNKIAIQTDMGYTYGTITSIVTYPVINTGDLIGGELSSFASHDLYDISTDAGFTMWIDMYWSSADDVITWINEN